MTPACVRLAPVHRQFIIYYRLLAALILWGSCMAGAAPLVALDFEGQPDSIDMATTQPPKVSGGDAVQIDCAVARTGKCSLRTKVANTPDYFSAGKQRVEWNLATRKELRYSAGDHVSYRFSVRVPEGWKRDVRASPDIIWQFKRFGSVPDAFVAIKGAGLVLRVFGSRQVVLLKELPTGQWIDLKFEVSWSPQASGKIIYQVQLAGQQKPVSSGMLEGANMINGKPHAGYIKFGIYKPEYAKSPDQAPRVVYIDDIIIERVQ
jgi:hypothetical protein